jgi:hypothetical protein
MPSTQGTGGGAVAPAPETLRSALGAQLDLARLRSGSGLVLYENLAWVPLLAVVPADQADSVPVDSADPTRAALGTDLAASAEPVDSDSGTVPRGTVLWSEAFDEQWSASGARPDLRHVEAFGWSNGYRLAAPGAVAIKYDDQWRRWVFLGASAVLWLVVAVWWWRTRVRRQLRRDSAAAAARRERRERHDPMTEILDEDAFWWERV